MITFDIITLNSNGDHSHHLQGCSLTQILLSCLFHVCSFILNYTSNSMLVVSQHFLKCVSNEYVKIITKQLTGSIARESECTFSLIPPTLSYDWLTKYIICIILNMTCWPRFSFCLSVPYTICRTLQNLAVFFLFPTQIKR